MHSARLHKTSRRDAVARDETYWAETETYCFETEIQEASVQDRDETLVRLETETSRLRPHPWKQQCHLKVKTDTDGGGVWSSVSSWMRDEPRSKVSKCYIPLRAADYNDCISCVA